MVREARREVARSGIDFDTGMMTPKTPPKLSKGGEYASCLLRQVEVFATSKIFSRTMPFVTNLRTKALFL